MIGGEGLEIAKITLMRSHDLIHISYMKKITTSDYCEATESLSFLYNAPFGQILTREPFLETVKLRRQRWQSLIVTKEVLLQSDFSIGIAGPLKQIKLSINTKEMSPVRPF